MLIDVKETALPNGVRVLSSAMPHLQSVAVGVWVGVGGRYETRRQSGVSHFIEHLLFKGTDKLSARDISQAIEGRGGYCDAFTQEEMTCYYARVASDHLWLTLGILTEMYLHPRFSEDDIEKERGVIIEEIMMYRDQPEQVVHEVLNESLWVDHELGRSLAGTPANIRAMTREQILTFKTKKYVSENTVFTFAGRVSHDECVAQVAKLMKRVRALPDPAYKLVTPAVPQQRLALRAKEIEQTQLALGFRLFGRFDKRRYVLKMLNVVLGENMSSRLFQMVREKHGLAYSIHSSVQLFAETGVLVIGAGLDRNRKDTALEMILREIRRLCREPISAKELERAREYVSGHLRLGLESPSGHMMWMGEHALTYGKSVSAEEILESVNAVTADEIQKLAATIFRERSVSLAMISPGLGSQDETRYAAMLGAVSET